MVNISMLMCSSVHFMKCCMNGSMQYLYWWIDGSKNRCVHAFLQVQSKLLLHNVSCVEIWAISIYLFAISLHKLQGKGITVWREILFVNTFCKYLKMLYYIYDFCRSLTHFCRVCEAKYLTKITSVHSV